MLERDEAVKGILERVFDRRLAAGLVVTASGALFTTTGLAAFLPSNSIVVEVRRSDCAAAVRLVNPEVKANDVQTAFIAGRLLDEGVCVHEDPEAAAHYFARAAELGDRDAVLDFAAKVGLGEGTEQDYERAGELCRAAGIDPQSRFSNYSLGYACTLRGVAGKLLRKTLPEGAFKPMAGAAVGVEFTPASGQMRVLRTPHVGTAEAQTGSWAPHPLINAPQEIDKAWRNALAAAPKPDAARLDNQPLELTIDVDMTLSLQREDGQARNQQPFQSLFQGDLHGTLSAH
jgi:hypothetical protein